MLDNFGQYSQWNQSWPNDSYNKIRPCGRWYCRVYVRSTAKNQRSQPKSFKKLLFYSFLKCLLSLSILMLSRQRHLFCYSLEVIFTFLVLYTKMDKIWNTCLISAGGLSTFENRQNASKDNFDTRSTGSLLLLAISDFTSVAYIEFWHKILEEVNLVQQYLHSPKMTLEKRLMKLKALNEFSVTERTAIMGNAVRYFV